MENSRFCTPSCLIPCLGVLWISSDRDDIEGFFGVWNFQFWVVKFGKHFSVWPGLSWDFFGYSEHDSACVSQPHSSAIYKVQPNLFPFLEIFNPQRFGMGFFGINLWSRDFFKFWFLAPFDNPCHLKSEVPPYVTLFMFQPWWWLCLV